MFKALNRKRKGNKGFTLIELIVVIAILAILALLLVPRFAGFTESAKLSADEAAMKTIEKAVLTLVATDQIRNDSTTTDIKININNSTTSSAGAISISSGTNAGSLGPNVESAIQNLIGTDYKAQKAGKTGFQATVDVNEEVEVDYIP